MNVAFDPRSKTLLDSFVSHPSHALIISSEKGVGCLYAAKYIVEKMKLTRASTIIIAPKNNTISIDEIRALYRMTKSSRDEPLVVIIDDADTMGSDAQNALLKLLEEPPKQVHFILTTHYYSHLLPTITSRSTHVNMRDISADESNKFLSGIKTVDDSNRSKILFLATGKPAEMLRLTQDTVYFEQQVLLMNDAKTILETNTYERLIILKSYMNDRTKALVILEMTVLLLMHGIYKGITKSSLDAANAVTDSIEALNKNGNVRAHLLLLAQRLP